MLENGIKGKWNIRNKWSLIKLNWRNTVGKIKSWESLFDVQRRIRCFKYRDEFVQEKLK